MKCVCQCSVLSMIILHPLSGPQFKSSGEQLKIHDLFLDIDKLQLYLAVNS